MLFATCFNIVPKLSFAVVNFAIFGWDDTVARNAWVRKHEAVPMANRNHPVFLSARLRNQIQQILLGDFASLLSDENNYDENDFELLTFDKDTVIWEFL
jgi:hypothetical protein